MKNTGKTTKRTIRCRCALLPQNHAEGTCHYSHVEMPSLRAQNDKSMEKRTSIKMAEPKNIEISPEAHEKLRGLQLSLEKILRKKQVSFDQVIKVMLAVSRLEDTLINMQLEGGIER